VGEFDTYDYLGPWEPATAFAAAVAGCFAYFSLLGWLMQMVTPSVPPLVVILLPVVCCGLFHYVVVRNSGLPKVRQWVQVAGSALFAPLLAGLLVVSWNST
jgi:hypothetical protein